MSSARVKKPLVSVVMPAHNGASFLDQALASLAQQDYGHLEIIVVDDGSTDNTALVAQSYANEDVRFRFEQQEHSGAGQARNYGLQKATGDYVIFLDADDVFESRLISSLVNLACDTSADVAVCSADCFTVNPATPLRSWEARRMELRAGVYTCQQLSARLYQCLSVVVWNKLWKKSFVDSAQLRFQNTPRFNDAFFTITGLALAGTIAKTDEVLVHYRVANGDSLVDKSYEYPLCDLEVFDAARACLAEKGLLTPPLKRSFASLCVNTITWRLSKFALVSHEATKTLYESYFGTYISKWGLNQLSFPYIYSPRYALEHFLIKQSGVSGLMWAAQGDSRDRSSGSNIWAELRFIVRLAISTLSKGRADGRP